MTSARGVINLCGPTRPRRAAGGVRGRRVRTPPSSTGGRVRSRSVPRRCWRCGSATPVSSGWELHIPTEYTAHVYDVLWDAGQRTDRQRRLPGDRPAAGREGLRVLVDRRHARHDAARGRSRVARSTGTRATSVGARRSSPSATRRRATGCARSRSTARRGTASTPSSGEAIILGDEVVGFTTTANFGDTIGRPIAYGYVPVEHLDRTDWVIEVYGEADPGDETRRRAVRPEGGARLRA